MRVVTMTDAVSLGTIVSAAQRKAKVARAMDSGYIAYGIARSIGDENGNFLTSDEDVRDGYLRVTLNTGFEAFWPVSELKFEVPTGEFVVDYDW